MKQILRLYSSSRIVLLLTGELSIILASFTFAIAISFPANATAVMWASSWKVVSVTLLMLLCAYYMDLYDYRSLAVSRGTYIVVIKLIGVIAVILGAVAFVYPEFFVGRNTVLLALAILAPLWLLWRTTCERLILRPTSRERIYLIGDGELAARVFNIVEARNDLGMAIASWERHVREPQYVQRFLERIARRAPGKHEVRRVIVALSDRRCTLPVDELLDLRLNGVIVEEATTLLENISGKIEIDELRPSWLIFRRRISPPSQPSIGPPSRFDVRRFASGPSYDSVCSAHSASHSNHIARSGALPAKPGRLSSEDIRVL